MFRGFGSCSSVLVLCLTRVSLWLAVNRTTVPVQARAHVLLVIVPGFKRARFLYNSTLSHPGVRRSVTSCGGFTRIGCLAAVGMCRVEGAYLFLLVGAVGTAVTFSDGVASCLEVFSFVFPWNGLKTIERKRRSNAPGLRNQH